MALHRIFGYSWQDGTSNELMLCEVGLRQVACIVRGTTTPLRAWGATPTEDPPHRLVEIRRAGPCRGDVRVLLGCVERTPI